MYAASKEGSKVSSFMGDAYIHAHTYTYTSTYTFIQLIHHHRSDVVFFKAVVKG